MYALLSPAKKLNQPTVEISPTIPTLIENATELVDILKQYSSQEFGELCGISDNLATLNVGRFQSFNTPFTPANASPAATTFAGDTYVGLDAATCSKEEMLWAQKHIGILSGLYGLLRPLDLMQAYRLEMGTRLPTDSGKNLYQYWGSAITKQINIALDVSTDKTVVNLASNEYWKSVKPKLLAGPVVTPVFKETRPDGTVKVISFLAKRARGSFARFLIDNRVETAAELTTFDRDGYRYQPDQSDGSTLLFIR